MKKIIMAFTAAAIYLLMANNNVNAQMIMGSKAFINLEKLSSLDSATNPAGSNLSTATNLSNVNVHAVKDFQKSFKNANATWYQANDGGYIAKFNDGTIKNLVAYTAKGNLHHSIRYYGEKQMPRDVRATVKSSYYDYTIVGVTEVHYEDQLVYVVLIQDDTTIKTLRICDGEMTEYNTLKRG